MATKLKYALAGSLSDEELKLLVGAYDVVGDIAIIIITEPLVAKEHLIGRAVLQINKKIKVVAKRVGVYGGEFRTIGLEIIAGENRKETEVKEFGLRFKVNPEEVYFSIRSGSERRRVASLVTKGEKVLVLFSGIAPYPLVISKYSEALNITGIEKNPRAHAYAVENVKMNKRTDNITLVQADAQEWLSSCDCFFDRLIMVLPTRGEDFLGAALRVLKPGGMLHFYDMQHSDHCAQTVQKIERICVAENRKLDSSMIARCGHCGPRTFRICVDARIC